MSGAPVNRDRIRIDGGVIVAFQDGGHRILTDGVVVVEGNEIVHVGKKFDGPADRVIDARNAIVTPGLINTHSHLTESPLDKSFIEDQGRRQFYYSGLFEMLPARSAGIDDDGRRACVDYSMGELLRTGTTTVMEIGGFGVLSKIRQSSPNAATPVILVTQVAEKDTLERCLAAGANAYHLKPVERGALLAIVRDQLAARAKTTTSAR